jgi:hypothetical protein
MPVTSKHLQIARENESFCEFLISQQSHLKWAVTGYFYAAIHFVEAHLASKGSHSASHRARDSEILSDPKLMGIYIEFSELKNDSTQARYKGNDFSVSDISSRVKPNEEHVKNHLFPSTPTPPSPPVPGTK